MALSQLISERRIAQGSPWVVPADLHAPIRQGAVLLASGGENPASSALLVYLRGREVLR